jgi:hypothetical protein
VVMVRTAEPHATGKLDLNRRTTTRAHGGRSGPPLRYSTADVRLNVAVAVQMSAAGGMRHSRFARPVRPTLRKRLKPRHSTLRLFQFCRWQVDRERNILVHERLPLLRAEGHRMDVASWLRGLGLEQ